MTVAHQIGVLALPGVMALDLGIPLQVFRVARDAAGTPLYQVRVCTPGRRPVPSTAGLSLHAERGLGLLAEVDSVIVPGIDPTALDQAATPAVIAALRAAAARGARIMSICTGAFVLARAGLLDTRPATTHWAYENAFRADFPDIELRPDVLFVDDGAVLTSAGVAAGLDLCLHVVRRDHGAEIANRTARRCVVSPWRDGGQSQFIERPLPAAGDASTSATRTWALARLSTPVDLADLADHARMSVRTFTRRFREETGMSPGRWLTQQRVEHARRLLESTDLPVDRVAAEAGFGTATSLRQHLRSSVSMSPAGYRRAFRPF
jgi:transcriptional regulator GlxA family with amidase domain